MGSVAVHEAEGVVRIMLFTVLIDIFAHIFMGAAVVGGIFLIAAMIILLIGEGKDLW